MDSTNLLDRCISLRKTCLLNYSSSIVFNFSLPWYHGSKLWRDWTKSPEFANSCFTYNVLRNVYKCVTVRYNGGFNHSIEVERENNLGNSRHCQHCYDELEASDEVAARCCPISHYDLEHSSLAIRVKMVLTYNFSNIKKVSQNPYLSPNDCKKYSIQGNNCETLN